VNALAGSALGLWFLVSFASIPLWLPSRRTGQRSGSASTTALVTVVVILGAATCTVAVLAGLAPPLLGRWTWLGLAIAVVAALLTGGPLTTSLLSLADASSGSANPRVQRTVLRGGAWIGALERLTMAASIVGGWSAGIAVIVAVKGLGRYPDLKAGQGSGAAERFIIGTFASLGWAAACAGIGLLLV
jgi:hypothetical protein